MPGRRLPKSHKNFKGRKNKVGPRRQIRRNIKLNDRVFTITLVGDATTYSTSVGGSIAVSHVINPVQLGTFSTYGTLFKLYRVVGLIIYMTPMSQANGMTYSVVDMLDSTLPTIVTINSQAANSFTNTSSAAPTRMVGGVRTTGYQIRNPFPKSLINASGSFFQWMEFNATPDVWFKIYTDATLGSPVSTVLWQTRVEYTLQFREQKA